jgi:hypothetical protein
MSYFKNATVTGAEIYAAAKEVCSRLYIANGGDASHLWEVFPFPGTAALERTNIGGTVVWKIFMPAMAMDARLNRAEADTIMAFVTHELGHALFTDYRAWGQAVTAGLHTMVNGLEDYRVERKLCAIGGTLINAKDQLTILTEYMTSRAVLDGWKPENPNALAFTLYSYACTASNMGLCYDVPSMPDLDRALPAPLLAFVKDIMARLVKCQSTTDVLALAHWIAGEMATRRQAAQAANAQSQGQKGKGQGQGQGQGKGQGQGQGQGQKGSPADADTDADTEGEEGEEAEDANAKGQGDGKGEGKGKGEGGDAQGGKSEGDTEGKGGSGFWSEADASDAAQMPTQNDLSDLADRVNDRIGADTKEVTKDNHGVTEFLNVEPSELRAKNAKRAAEANAARTENIASRLSTPAKLRRDVTRAVRSPDLSDIEHYQTKGRFDRRAYTRAEAGASTVFRRMSEAKGQAAAVSLLLDLSSSMAGERAIVATCLALHLGDALKAASVPFEIGGFVTPHGHGGNNGVHLIKRYEDGWIGTRDQVTLMTNMPTGGTAMLPGMKFMVDRLVKRGNVSRRILLVLTDGEDNYSRESNRAMVKAARAKGVEIIGIGVQHDASPAFGKANHIHVPNLTTVATDGLTGLVKALEDPNKRRND